MTTVHWSPYEDSRPVPRNAWGDGNDCVACFLLCSGRGFTRSSRAVPGLSDRCIRRIRVGAAQPYGGSSRHDSAASCRRGRSIRGVADSAGGSAGQLGTYGMCGVSLRGSPEHRAGLQTLIRVRAARRAPRGSMPTVPAACEPRPGSFRGSSSCAGQDGSGARSRLRMLPA